MDVVNTSAPPLVWMPPPPSRFGPFSTTKSFVRVLDVQVHAPQVLHRQYRFAAPSLMELGRASADALAYARAEPGVKSVEIVSESDYMVHGRNLVTPLW